jgi:hypothetical protein
MFRLGSTPSSAKGGSASGGNSPLQRGRMTSETTTFLWDGLLSMVFSGHSNLDFFYTSGSSIMIFRR